MFPDNGGGQWGLYKDDVMEENVLDLDVLNFYLLHLKIHYILNWKNKNLKELKFAVLSIRDLSKLS